MITQARLLAVLKKRGERVADLARAFGLPYTTVREWVVHGRIPVGNRKHQARLERVLARLENTGTKKRRRKDLGEEALDIDVFLNKETGGHG